MTEDQEQLVRDLISLARIEMQVRVLRAVADVLASNNTAELLTDSLYESAAVIEKALGEMQGRTRYAFPRVSE